MKLFESIYEEFTDKKGNIADIDTSTYDEYDTVLDSDETYDPLWGAITPIGDDGDFIGEDSNPDYDGYIDYDEGELQYGDEGFEPTDNFDDDDSDYYYDEYSVLPDDFDLYHFGPSGELNLTDPVEEYSGELEYDGPEDYEGWEDNDPTSDAEYKQQVYDAGDDWYM